MNTNLERELIAIDKLEDIHETFIQQLGRAALEIMKDECGDELGYLDKPEALAPEDVNRESLMERETELDNWKFVIVKILNLTHQRVVQVVNDNEAYESGTF